MKKFLNTLKSCPLFADIEEADLESMLSCLNAKVVTYRKNQFIFEEGSPALWVGILLSGRARILKEDYNGNRNIVAHIEPGELFGEVFACAHVDELPVSVLSDEETQAMLLDCRRIITFCSGSCHFHTKLINNLLRIVAQKSLLLNQKIDLLSKGTTKDKLMAYLFSQARKYKSNEFTIPYDRQGLADYLGVERSAMSAEISKLCKEGIIETKKSRFKIITAD